MTSPPVDDVFERFAKGCRALPNWVGVLTRREFFVEDLGSRNGTFVNGQPVDGTMRLRRGDRVQFGQTVAELLR